MDLPTKVEGQAYWPHLSIPNWNMDKTKTFYEVNLAVSDDIFKMFKEAGFSSVFLRPPGDKTYTPDAVIKFATFGHSTNGEQNPPPTMYDKAGKQIPSDSIRIGNGSTIAVEYDRYEYGKLNKIVRARLLGVHIVDLIEYAPAETQQPAFSA